MQRFTSAGGAVPEETSSELNLAVRLNLISLVMAPNIILK